MELRGSYLEVKIHSPKNPIGEFVARGCRIWLTLMAHQCIPLKTEMVKMACFINYLPFFQA